MTQSLPGRLFEAECGLASRLFRTSWLSLTVAFSLTCGWHDGQWWWLEYTDVSSNGNDWNPSGPRADMTPLPAFGQRFEFELEAMMLVTSANMEYRMLRTSSIEPTVLKV